MAKGKKKAKTPKITGHVYDVELDEVDLTPELGVMVEVVLRLKLDTIYRHRASGKVVGSYEVVGFA